MRNQAGFRFLYGGAMKFIKPPISIQNQIIKLKNRGLIFNDEIKAAHYLSNISYYRLRAYTYPFQDNNDSDTPFTREISFEDIMRLYVFDRKLRGLVFDAIEKIEVALRTKLSYIYSLRHGSHWQEDSSLFYHQDRFQDDYKVLCEEVKRSKETFIEHYKRKYTHPSNPPCWMTLEVASMGTLSRIYQNLKNSPEKRVIAKEFGLYDHTILQSWIHTFSHIRNLCAHHSRLWNSRLKASIQLPRNAVYPFLQNLDLYNNKLYASLSCIAYVLDIISPGNEFKPRLLILIEECNLADRKDMGFPKNWEMEPFWQTQLLVDQN
jgi:abortive infection bacteriophage resistance protein